MPYIYMYIYINQNSRRIWMLLLRAEGYLRIVKVNVVTNAKRTGFELRAQRVTFSSSTTELPLRLWLYYPGGSITCIPTRLELVSFQDQRKCSFFPRTVLYPFIEYSAVGAPVRWALLHLRTVGYGWSFSTYIYAPRKSIRKTSGGTGLWNAHLPKSEHI